MTQIGQIDTDFCKSIFLSNPYSFMALFCYDNIAILVHFNVESTLFLPSVRQPFDSPRGISHFGGF